MELNSIDYLLYKYPDNPIAKFILYLIFLAYGFNVPEDHNNLRIEWSKYFGEWYVTHILDGYDDETIATLGYVSDGHEDTLKFRISDEREHNRYKFLDIPLSFIKVTEIPNG